MNKLPKEIYVDEKENSLEFYINAEHAARSGETITLGVYKLVGKVEVSTEMKQEIIVKKSKKPTAKVEPIAVEIPERSPLLDEMKVTG